MISPEFLLTSLVVILIPGTGAVYTINTGLALHSRASMAAAIGCTLGIVPHILASILGLSALLNMSAQVFSVLKLAGSVYLLYLAWQMWREAGMLEIKSGSSAETSYGQIILKAIAINLLNPKLSVFFFAFLPLFVTKGTSAGAEMIKLSAVFMGLTFVVFAIYGLLASGIRGYLLRSSTAVKRIQRGFALILAGFAVKLAFSEK